MMKKEHHESSALSQRTEAGRAGGLLRRQGARGVILLLALLITLGLGSIGARSAISLSVLEQRAKVDALYHLVHNFRVLWGYKQTVLEMANNAQRGSVAPYLGVADLGEPQPILRDGLGQVSANIGGNSAFTTSCNLGIFDIVKPQSRASLIDVQIADGYGMGTSSSTATPPPASPDTLTDLANAPPEPLPSADVSNVPEYCAALEQMTQDINPMDLGYDLEALGCNNTAGEPRHCWGATQDLEDQNTLPPEADLVSFWIETGDSTVLGQLLERLRTDMHSSRAVFCPITREELNLGIGTTQQDFQLRCDNYVWDLAGGVWKRRNPQDQSHPRENSHGTQLILEFEVEEATVIDMLSRQRLDPRGGVGNTCPGSSCTVLLGTYQLAENPLNLDFKGDYNLDVNWILYNLSQVSTEKLYPAWLHPYDAYGIADTLGESPKDLAGLATYDRVFNGFSASDYIPSNSKAPVINIQPFVSEYPNNTEYLCYLSAEDKYPTTTTTADWPEETLSLPKRCQNITDMMNAADEYNYATVGKQLGEHPGYGTEFPLTNNQVAYSPHMLFAPPGRAGGKSGMQQPPVLRGGIVARYMRVNHLLGEIHLVPGVGVKDAGTWPNVTSAWVPNAGNTTLTVPVGNVVFSESIEVGSTGSLIKLVSLTNGGPSSTLLQRIPEDGSFWPESVSQDTAALQSIRPYRYIKTETDGNTHAAIGLLAQEVIGYYPDMTRSDDGTLALRYYGLLPVLYSQIKAQDEAHQQRLLSLQQRLLRIRKLAAAPLEKDGAAG